MENNFQERLKQLENKIKISVERLKLINEELVKQEIKSSEEIRAKEKKIEEIKSELWNCQDEKDNIQKSLGDKIKELEYSNLTKEDKSDKIIALVGDSFERLSGCSQSLNKLWTSYASSRDKVVEILKERDKHAYEAITTINDTKKGLWIIIWILLIIIVLLCLTLLFTTKKIKKVR